MQPNHFSEEDLKRFTEALNFIAKEAKFGKGEPGILYIIETRNHFAFLQNMAKKVEANILEVKKLHQPKTEEPKKKPTKSKK